MKAIKVFWAVLFCALFLCSCGTSQDKNEPVAEPEMKEPEQVVEVVEELKAQDLTFSLRNRRETGVTLHVVVFTNGDESDAYNYALLVDRFFCDYIRDSSTENGDSEIFRYIYDPEYVELPIIWDGVDRGDIIYVSDRAFSPCFLELLEDKYEFGEMEFEGTTYYYEEFPNWRGEYNNRFLYSGSELKYVLAVGYDGELYVNAADQQIVRQITSITDGVDESLFDVPQGRQPVYAP
ncbi:MAG: hypothetical protein IJ091_05910 [Oscillospiraceae bacterium]|nr:hypothetical protein [Oscillospiraceae bacterium]